VSPFLASMNPLTQPDNPNYRDFVSSFLLEIIDEIQIMSPAALIKEVSSMELKKHFPDAIQLLREKSHEGRIVGAIIPSHIDLEKYLNIEQLSRTAGFRWIRVEDQTDEENH
jgi:hypothetical protein